VLQDFHFPFGHHVQPLGRGTGCINSVAGLVAYLNKMLVDALHRFAWQPRKERQPPENAQAQIAGVLMRLGGNQVIRRFSASFQNMYLMWLLLLNRRV